MKMASAGNEMATVTAIGIAIAIRSRGTVTATVTRVVLVAEIGSTNHGLATILRRIAGTKKPVVSVAVVAGEIGSGAKIEEIG